MKTEAKYALLSFFGEGEGYFLPKRAQREKQVRWKDTHFPQGLQGFLSSNTEDKNNCFSLLYLPASIGRSGLYQGDSRIG